MSQLQPGYGHPEDNYVILVVVLQTVQISLQDREMFLKHVGGARSQPSMK